MEREFINFCSNCGQKLSWESYLKGDIETEYCPPLYQNEAVIAEESSLEMCVAADGRFTALQLFRFVNYEYTPVTEVCIYEEAESLLIQKLF